MSARRGIASTLRGLLVVAGWWLRAASAVIVGLTSVFAVAIVSALARGLNIECGCFGTIAGRRIGLSSLGIDAALLGMATVLAWRAGGCGPKQFPEETGERTSASPREVSPG